jgi:DNA repair protein RecO
VIVETEAIVLRAMKHGETSKIVTLYTRSFGKVNVIAKGARDMKSKFGGALEMFARISAVFYKKERAEAGLYLLSKAEIVDGHRNILSDLDRIEAATAVCELVLRAIHDEEEHPEIFDLLAASLGEIAAGSILPILLQFEFYLEFLKIMGFAIAGNELRRLTPDAKAWLLNNGGQSLADKTQHELHSFFRSYFAEHVPGMTSRSMRSEKVFSSL